MLGRKTIADSSRNAAFFVGISSGSSDVSKMDPKALVTMLNEIFTKFTISVTSWAWRRSRRLRLYGCGGVPTPDPDHANKIAEMGLKMIDTSMNTLHCGAGALLEWDSFWADSC